MSNKKGVVLPDRAREIVFNVYKFFESEKQVANELLQQMNIARILMTSDDDAPITAELFILLHDFLKSRAKVTELVSSSTGVNKNTITRIKKEREGTLAVAAGTGKIRTSKKKPRGKKILTPPPQDDVVMMEDLDRVLES